MSSSSNAARSGPGEETSLLGHGQEKITRFWQGFVDFALQGNLLEFAFGLILANAFTALTKEFVTDILLPPMSLVMPLQRNMGEKFAVLHPGPNCDPDTGYNTPEQAREDGAVVLAYGSFINSIVSFFCMGMILYVAALAYSRLSRDNIIKRSIKCPYCRKRISDKASRCVNCTSWVDGREDRPRN